jgi:RNA polymerase sigma factor (TIGR02999 family)
MSDVTRILSQIDSGDRSAAAQLLPLVYDELRKLAAAKLAQERPGQTLQATALLHEAYLRLVGNSTTERSWDSRGHFFAAAAEAMRRILVEQARRKKSIKHGGGQAWVELLEADIACQVPAEELLDLDEALARLAAEDPVKARLVELRFFVGMSNEQAAELLGISSATAKRYWRFARAWLHQAVRGGDQTEQAAENSSKMLPGD